MPGRFTTSREKTVEAAGSGADELAPDVSARRVARMVKGHLEGLVNAIHHGVTNARAEGINSRIQWIKYTARGFRSRKRFRRAIDFHLGDLNMAPEALSPIVLHTA